MTDQIYKITGNGNKYVAAVIQGPVKLKKWLNRVPERTLKKLKIESLTGRKSYPFSIVEGKTQEGNTIFLDTTDTEEAKKLFRSVGITVLATYKIDGDFMGDPTQPGMDYMGALDHEHEAE